MLVFDSTKLSRHVSPAAAELQNPHFLQPDQPCKVPTTTPPLLLTNILLQSNSGLESFFLHTAFVRVGKLMKTHT